MSLSFVDLFSGIGGFHLALANDPELRANCVFACDIDPVSQSAYTEYFGTSVSGDITKITSLGRDGIDQAIPDHDILTAGFPCQPFSKSGYQRGIEEARGTLFYDICQVVAAKSPRYLILENVMNLVGRRHRETWATMLRLMRGLGYAVSPEPTVLSPHQLPPDKGGSPQNRERVFIPAIYVGVNAAERLTTLPPIVDRRPFPAWSPDDWRIERYLDPDTAEDEATYGLADERVSAVEMWNQLLPLLEELRGYPLWADVWAGRLQPGDDKPGWKNFLITQNDRLFRANDKAIRLWLDRYDALMPVEASYRKLEWHAGKRTRNLWCHAIQFRPSGIRVRPLTYLPALVAIGQTSIIGPRRRRITPREAARLQGFPDEFRLPGIGRAYRLVGNAVHVGTTRLVARRLVLGTTAEAKDPAPEAWQLARQVAVEST